MLSADRKMWFSIELIYITSSDMNWKTDVTGDDTAKNSDVDVIVDAEKTGNTITVTCQIGGITADQTFNFIEYKTENGTFTLLQWTGVYFQQLADVTTKAEIGVAMHATATPAEGYVFDAVEVFAAGVALVSSEAANGSSSVNVAA